MPSVLSETHLIMHYIVYALLTLGYIIYDMRKTDNVGKIIQMSLLHEVLLI
jgi:hypothetical protein